MDWVDVPNPPRRYRCVNRACTERASVDAQRLEAWVVRQTFAAGDELSTRSEVTDLGAIEEALATSERRLDQVLAPDARDALGDLWAADVKERRAERDALLTELGQARQLAGPTAELRLREVWDGLSPGDRREALALFWKEIRVGRRQEEGGTPVTFVARGPHGEAEVELPAD